MHTRLIVSILVSLIVCLLSPISGSAVVSSQWVIFDAGGSASIYGNPAYTGRFGVPYFADKQVDEMYFGRTHALALTSDGQMRGWGPVGIAYGSSSAFSLVPIDTWSNVNQRVVSVAATDGGSVLVLDDGKVYFAGTIEPSSLKTTGGWSYLFASLLQFKKVKCGYAHCVVQGVNGKLYGFGANDVGQINSGPGTAVSSITEIPNLPQNTITSSSKIAFCTGAHHSAIIIDSNLYLLGNCRALGISCILPSRIPIVISLSGLSQIQQLECGAQHTVIKTASGVFAIGDNEVGQVDPFNPGLPIPTLTHVGLTFGSMSRIFVVGNTTVGRSSDNLQGQIQVFGINGTDEAGLGALIGQVNFPRPSWLRLESNDKSIGSPLRNTMGIRFTEEDSCEDPRPMDDAVCAKNAAGKGRWSMQHSLQMAKGRAHSDMTLQRPLTVYGDFILGSDATMNFQWPADPSSPSLEVDGCAQINGAVYLSVPSDVVSSIRKDHKGKLEVKLVQSKCPFFANAKRDIEVILTEYAYLAPEDVSGPDISVEPTDNAQSGQSQTKTVSYQPVASPSSSSSSCSKTSITTQQQTDGPYTSLVAVINVNSSSCNTWWIITVSVICGVIFILAIAGAIIFLNPKLRSKILPYFGSN